MLGFVLGGKVEYLQAYLEIAYIRFARDYDQSARVKYRAVSAIDRRYKEKLHTRSAQVQCNRHYSLVFG